MVARLVTGAFRASLELRGTAIRLIALAPDALARDSFRSTSGHAPRYRVVGFAGIAAGSLPRNLPGGELPAGTWEAVDMLDRTSAGRVEWEDVVARRERREALA